MSVASSCKRARKSYNSKLSIWSSSCTDQHPLKMQQTEGINADRVVLTDSWLGVFDGVSGVKAPWTPSSMSDALSTAFVDQLCRRFSPMQAQAYDNALECKLQGRRDQNKSGGEWLHNLLISAFLSTRVGVMGVDGCTDRPPNQNAQHIVKGA
jgi:hypothetical protein